MSALAPLRRVVLASGSPRRLELLRMIGLEVAVVPSGYAEPDRPGLSPELLAAEHARCKLDDVRARTPGEFVIAADTVVDVDGTAFGKPRDAAHARRMLRELSGRSHLVHTAFALAWNGAAFDAISTSAVTFYALSGDEIAQYARTDEPFDKAGAYGIQGYGATFVERIDGDFYTVMGFPLARFVRSLPRLGFALSIAKEPLQTP